MLLLSIGGNAEKTEALKLQAFISAIIWMRVHFFSLKKKKKLYKLYQSCQPGSSEHNRKVS